MYALITNCGRRLPFGKPYGTWPAATALAFAFLASGFNSTARASTLVKWTFESATISNTGKTSGPYVPETNNTGSVAGASGLHASATTVYSSPSGNGGGKSFSSTVWATNDYYQLNLSTTGYSGISFSFDQGSSSSGPRDFKVQYSTDGTNFTQLGSSYVLTNANFSGTASTSFSHSFSDVATPVLANVASLTLRIVDTSTTATNGSPVATSGSDRIDNFDVEGTAAAPEPTSLALLGAAATPLVLRRGRRQRA